ncbi:MAG TPA: serine protease [Methylomirabilota bacterium]|nr:serine protease [Methylomirabilota bacterium]
MRQLCIALLFAALLPFQSSAADAPPLKPAELSYDQIKKQFEQDEALEDVRVSNFSASEVTVIYKGRYIIYKMSNLTDTQRPKIETLISAEKERRRSQAVQDNEEAARAGMLREVDGVVYNLLKGAPGWVTLNGIVRQKIDDGLLVDISRSAEELDLIFLKNLPQMDSIADGDRASFMARQAGTATFLTTSKVPRTVRQYDCGTVPGKTKRPALVRSPHENSGQPRLDPAWGSSGTGFFITEDGYLVTCHHVVENGKRLLVKNSGGTFAAQLVASDKINDVAILKVAGRFSALAINTNVLALGQPTFTIGFPNIDIQGLSPKYTDGKVSSLSGIQDDASAIQISVPVQPGNSGGPLTDVNGNVIGVVVARLNDYAALKRTQAIPQNVNYAVKAVPLIALINRAGLAAKVKYSSAMRTEAVSTVEKATVLVLVGE